MIPDYVHVSQIATVSDLYNYMYVTNPNWILDFFGFISHSAKNVVH